MQIKYIAEVLRNDGRWALRITKTWTGWMACGFLRAPSEAGIRQALEVEAYVQLGKDKHWEISTLRLDVIRTALRNSGVAL